MYMIWVNRDTPALLSELCVIQGQVLLTFGTLVGMDSPYQNADRDSMGDISQYAKDVHVRHGRIVVDLLCQQRVKGCEVGKMRMHISAPGVMTWRKEDNVAACPSTRAPSSWLACDVSSIESEQTSQAYQT